MGIIGFDGVANLDMVGPLEVSPKPGAGRTAETALRGFITAPKEEFCFRSRSDFSRGSNDENAPAFDTITFPAACVIQRREKYFRMAPRSCRLDAAMASVSTGLFCSRKAAW